MDKNKSDLSSSKGAEIRARLLGPEFVDSKKTDLMNSYTDLAVEHLWGGFWARPGLELKTRSIAAIATMACLQQPDLLALHIKGALRNKLLTENEISEIIFQTIPYIGFPAGRIAVDAAGAIFQSQDRT
jgi:alkylhydroperoxidase/carboxymuconolactone decarboxylase family protein YurZ